MLALEMYFWHHTSSHSAIPSTADNEHIHFRLCHYYNADKNHTSFPKQSIDSSYLSLSYSKYFVFLPLTSSCLLLFGVAVTDKKPPTTRTGDTLVQWLALSPQASCLIPGLSFCMFSPCLCGFPPSTLASSNHPNICIWG